MLPEEGRCSPTTVLKSVVLPAPIFPAIDIQKSGTRREEMLLSQKELEGIWTIRKAMSNMGTADVTEVLTNKLMQTKSNKDFVDSLNLTFNDKF
jgi:transcription termination factor Rho